jgi:transposase
MDTVTISVGIDYHPGQLELCLMHRDGRILKQTRCRNDLAEVLALAPAGAVVHAALEASTGAAHLADALTEAGWSVSLAHPGFVRRMKQSPDKTDKQDAHVLADLVRVG